VETLAQNRHTQGQSPLCAEFVPSSRQGGSVTARLERDSLRPESVVPHLRGRFGRPYLYAAECPSTQDVLRASRHPEGAVAATEHQTAGRGRSGRRWQDAPGASLLFSLLLRPPASAPPPRQLSLVAALAVAEGVEAAVGVATQVKWPNDVHVEGKKVAGILLEASDGAVVCGIGINVNQTSEQLPPNARIEPASLRLLTGKRHDRAELLADLLGRLEDRYGTWLTDGLESLLPELEGRDALRSRRLAVGTVTGKGAGIAPDGRLAIAVTNGETVLVESGEVELQS
jgi:BirA family biotin operon repressor/biotin-[acetyl-CoA-carboxylase] ligase